MSRRPFTFCPYCAAPLQRAFLFGAERSHCPHCDWIHFEDPKVAAAALVEREGQVLLVRRVNDPHQGCWTLPAGFVDAHEDPAEAACRECLEETGLVVQITGLHRVIPGLEHPRGADFVVVYRAEVVGGTLLAGDDADAAAFFPRSALPPLAFRATRIALGLD